MPCPKVQGASTACAAADHFGGGLGGFGLGGGGLGGGGLGGSGLGGGGLGGGGLGGGGLGGGGLGGLGGGGLGGEGLQLPEPEVHSCTVSKVSVSSRPHAQSQVLHCG